jgi:hypothetical protein
VAGSDTALVSESATLARTTATLFYVYDSLIEKCSTLPAVRASERSRVPFSSKLSVGME